MYRGKRLAAWSTVMTVAVSWLLLFINLSMLEIRIAFNLLFLIIASANLFTISSFYSMVRSAKGSDYFVSLSYYFLLLLIQAFQLQICFIII